MVAAVAPVLTVPAVLVVPELVFAAGSSTAVPAAVDSPEYSTTASPTSAAAVGLAVIVGLVPPPAVIGAVHRVSWVPSLASLVARLV